MFTNVEICLFKVFGRDRSFGFLWNGLSGYILITTYYNQNKNKPCKSITVLNSKHVFFIEVFKTKKSDHFLSLAFGVKFSHKLDHFWPN